jgi:anthranilate phosphoribosyltransferase
VPARGAVGKLIFWWGRKIQGTTDDTDGTDAESGRGKARSACAFPLSARGRQGDNGGVSQPAPAQPASADAFDALLAALREKRAHEKEATAAAWALASESVTVEDKTKFLRELEENRRSYLTLAEFARVFRQLARNPGVEKWAGRAIDVCGTGGDHSGSYNISTTVAFILAAAGVPVFKHGNRSITSKSGSADFLHANGVPLEASDEVWRKSLEELNFAFFFAPAYHPAFKHVNPARKILATEGRRTIFNFLGPILNPGQPAFQLVGVYASWCVRMVADALTKLKVNRGLCVHGHIPGKSVIEGLDEMSVATANFVAGAGKLSHLGFRKDAPIPEEYPSDFSRFGVGNVSAKAVGLQDGTLEDLKGADANSNMQLLEALLDNRAPQGLIDTVCLNAGAALYIAGKINVSDEEAALITSWAEWREIPELMVGLKKGTKEARQLLTGGPVREWLKRTREFFQDHKI